MRGTIGREEQELGAADQVLSRHVVDAAIGSRLSDELSRLSPIMK